MHRRLRKPFRILLAVLFYAAAGAAIVAVTFTGVVQCSFRYDPPTASELAADPSLVRYK